MTDDEYNEMRRQILDAITFHRLQYDAAVKPYMDRLIQLEDLRPSRFRIRADQILNIMPTLPKEL